MSREIRRSSGAQGAVCFLGIPCDLQLPTWEHVRERAWNPVDRRLLTPRAFGWGYDLNVYELLARLGFIKR